MIGSRATKDASSGALGSVSYRLGGGRGGRRVRARDGARAGVRVGVRLGGKVGLESAAKTQPPKPRRSSCSPESPGMG